MSHWGDMMRRSSGQLARTEDIIKCAVKVYEIGKGRKAPKWLAVPDDVMVQQFTVVLSSPDEDDLIWRFLPLAWSYKVGKRNVDEFYQMYDSFLNEAGDFTYNSNKKKTTEECEQKLLELRERVAKHNEEVSEKPFWSVDPFCRDAQP